MRHGQLTITPKLNFTRNFYRLTGAARQKTAKRKTQENPIKRETRTKEEIILKTTGETHGTQSKDDFNSGISKLQREIISTHIQEYKRLKPKEVDQSELSRHAHRTSALTPIKQICPYENTREHTFKSIKD